MSVGKNNLQWGIHNAVWTHTQTKEEKNVTKTWKTDGESWKKQKTRWHLANVQWECLTRVMEEGEDNQRQDFNYTKWKHVTTMPTLCFFLFQRFNSAGQQVAQRSKSHQSLVCFAVLFDTDTHKKTKRWYNPKP